MLTLEANLWQSPKRSLELSVTLLIPLFAQCLCDINLPHILHLQDCGIIRYQPLRNHYGTLDMGRDYRRHSCQLPTDHAQVLPTYGSQVEGSFCIDVQLQVRFIGCKGQHNGISCLQNKVQQTQDSQEFSGCTKRFS